MNQEEMLDKILSRVIDIDGRLDEMATKEDLNLAKSTILTEVDRFAKLQENLDHENVSVRNRYDRLEERLVLVERKIGI